MKKFLSFLVISIFFGNGLVNAYDFQIGNNTLGISDNLKTKADIFLKKRVNTSLLKQKYLTALKKYNPNKLSSEKKALLYYLIAKLDGTKITTLIKQAENNSQTGTSSTSTKNNNQNLSNQITSSNQNLSSTLKIFSPSEQKSIFNPINLPEVSRNNGARVNTIGSLDSNTRLLIEGIKNLTKDYVETNNDFEFEEYSQKFRVNFSKYFIINLSYPLSTYSNISTIGNEILIKKGDTFIITSGGYSFEQKYSLTDISQKAILSTASDENVLFKIVDGYYYAYDLYSYKFFTIPEDGIYLKNYKGLTSLDNVILLYYKGKYLLITQYGTTKLFSTNYLEKIENPYLFLNTVGKDLYYYKKSDYLSIFDQIKNKTDEIIAGKNSDGEKIQAIYSRITANIKYDQYSRDYVDGKISESTYLSGVNNEVFSGIGIFKNLSGVCDGYSKLFLYMLDFAGINNASIELGNADIGNGKIIPHAWNRIGDYLYDVTWDINSKGDSSKFKYFQLSPSELYINHFKE